MSPPGPHPAPQAAWEKQIDYRGENVASSVNSTLVQE
jgi:hypothetical protein